MGYFSELDVKLAALSRDREDPLYAGGTNKQIEENITELLGLGLSLDEITVFLPGSLSSKAIAKAEEIRTHSIKPAQKVKK